MAFVEGTGSFLRAKVPVRGVPLALIAGGGIGAAAGLALGESHGYPLEGTGSGLTTGLILGGAGIWLDSRLRSNSLRRELMDAMAGQGILEIPTSGSQRVRYRQAIHNYLGGAQAEIVQAPAGVRIFAEQASYAVHSTHNALRHASPFGDRLWSNLAHIESAVEIVQANRTLADLERRLPARVPDELAGALTDTQEQIALAKAQRRRVAPYPDRAAVGAIQARVEMIEALLGQKGGDDVVR
jgi:hypothetical protein